MSGTLDAVTKLLRPLRWRLENMVSRAVVKLVDDAAKMQGLQVVILAGETRDFVERFQNYGFTSNPPAGSEAVLVFPGGNRSHPLAVAVDDRASRKTGLAEGEAAIYTKFGDYIHVKADGTIEVVASNAVSVTAPEVTVTAATKVTLDTPNCEITGDLAVGGDVIAEGAVADADGDLTEMRTVFNAHVHPGVTAGGASTGATATPMD